MQLIYGWQMIDEVKAATFQTWQLTVDKKDMSGLLIAETNGCIIARQELVEVMLETEQINLVFADNILMLRSEV